jgi:hypothetical protein
MPELLNFYDLAFRLVFQRYNGSYDELDITNRVVRDAYALEVRDAESLDFDKAEGTIKVLDADGVVEKILLGVQDGVNLPSFGAIRLDIYKETNLVKSFWLSGRYSRKDQILEIEYEAYQKVLTQASPLYNIADLNLLLADTYGVQCTGPAYIYAHSTKLSLALYVGISVPQDLQPWEVSSLKVGNTLYVLFRNILAKFDLTSKPWRVVKIVDIRNFTDSTDSVPVSAFINGAVYDVGIAGQIVGLDGTNLAVMVNVANSSITNDKNCYRLYRIDVNSFTLASKSGFFVKHTDIGNRTDLAYNFLAKLPDGRYAFMFKGLNYGTFVLSNAGSFYQAILTQFSQGNTITVYKPFAVAIDRTSYYDLFILGAPRSFKLQIYTGGVGGTTTYQDFTASGDTLCYAVGYYDSASQQIHFAMHRRGASETVQFCITPSSTLAIATQRTITGGKFMGMGYDDAYKQLEAVFTVQEGSNYTSKVFRQNIANSSDDKYMVATLSTAQVNRVGNCWLYLNTAVPTGGVGELGSTGNIYANAYDEQILRVCSAGFIIGRQFKRWSSVENSGLSLLRSEYRYGAKEGRELEAFRRYIVQTIDGQIIGEATTWWSGAEEEVSLPITSEMARYLLAIRRNFFRCKRYTVQSFKDIRTAIGKALSFENPEGNSETAVLLGYSFNTDGEYTYDVLVWQSDVDLDWQNENDVPSGLVLETSFSHKWKRESGVYNIYASLTFRSVGAENPLRFELRVYDMDGNQVYSEWHPVSNMGTIYSRISVATLQPQYLFVYRFFSTHETATFQYIAEMQGVNQPKMATISEIEMVATEGVIDNVNPFFYQEDYGWEFEGFALEWGGYIGGQGWAAVVRSGTTASITTKQKIMLRSSAPNSQKARKVLKIMGFCNSPVTIKVVVRLYDADGVYLDIWPCKPDEVFTFRMTTFLKPIDIPLYAADVLVYYYDVKITFEGDFTNYPLEIRSVAITSAVSKHNIIEGFKFAELLDVDSYTGQNGKFLKVKDDGSGLTFASLDQFISPPPVAPGDTNYWIAGLLNATTLTTKSITGGSRTYWWPFVVTRKITIQTVAINVTASATATVSIGVYSSTAQGYPNALLQSATVSYSAESGVKTASFSITLNPGLYWLAMRSSAGITVRAIPVGACMALRTPSLGTASVTDYCTSDSALPAQAPSSGYTAETGQPVPAVGFILL